MNICTKYPQFYLRLAVGVGFIVPVLDRLGLVGGPGHPNISWGDWGHFIGFTGMLMPFLSGTMVSVAGFIATLLEILFGICLILGFKTRIMAVGSFLLTLIFGLSMALFLGFKAPLNFSVFPCSAGSLLLATLAGYEWSLDNYLTRRTLIK
jgi:putative oxidoreductase